MPLPRVGDRIAWADPKYLSAGRSAAATGRRRAALDMSPFDGPDELTSSQLVRTVFLLLREGAHDLELAA